MTSYLLSKMPLLFTVLFLSFLIIDAAIFILMAIT